MTTTPNPQELHAPDEDTRLHLREDLLAWFDEHQRDLPWRKTSDPYAIWVSEIMLQQTQVITVKDYYTRWMQTFPDVQSLASADRDDVMKMWAGLGYYRRARFLHEGAQMVVDDFDGSLPSDVKGLKKIKGIGNYTAGAISSIAFDQVEPLVDGNVERVFARLFAIPGDPKQTSNQKLFWSIARDLVDPLRPGDFNQSLMELGAVCCTPKSPTCLLCPVREHCKAHALGDTASYPAKVKRAKAKPVQSESLVIIANTPTPQILLYKRSGDGLLAGLMEAPSTPHSPRDTRYNKSNAMTRLASLFESEGLEIPLDSSVLASAKHVGHVKHLFSHLDMRIHIFLVELDAWPDGFVDTLETSPSWSLVSTEELSHQALSKAQKKVFRSALSSRESSSD